MQTATHKTHVWASPSEGTPRRASSTLDRGRGKTTDSSLTDSYSVVSSTYSRRSGYLLQWRTSSARHRSRVPRPP
eukprot:9250505-Pyramimonas_sp.AAC.1